MRLLFLGDVVGSPGRRIIKENVKRLKKELSIGAVVANAENCAAGSGITAALAEEIRDCGVDAITLGDHTWGQKEFATQIDTLGFVARPANFPQGCPGKGWLTVTLPTASFAVVNLQGRTFMNPIDCPFRTIDRVLAEIPKNLPVFIDFHAEATSEKIALASYVDGRVTAVVGTHTHVQTSDAFILPDRVSDRSRHDGPLRFVHRARAEAGLEEVPDGDAQPVRGRWRAGDARRSDNRFRPCDAPGLRHRDVPAARAVAAAAGRRAMQGRP